MSAFLHRNSSELRFHLLTTRSFHMSAIVDSSDRRKYELLEHSRDFILCRNLLNSYCSQTQLEQCNVITEINSLFETNSSSTASVFNSSLRQVDSRGVVIQSVEDLFSVATNCKERPIHC